MVNSIQKFRPAESIFELGKRGSKTAEALLMQKRRKQFAKAIVDTKQKTEDIAVKETAQQLQVIERKKTQEGDVEVDFSGFNDITTKPKRKGTVTF
jgi:ATP-dependent RNA helicase DDX54/DBP10